jgi:uncharacterized protein YvpB
VKKIIVTLLFAFVIGGYLGYLDQNLRSSPKSNQEKKALAKQQEDLKNVINENGKVLITDVPLIQQMPELNRGCEVTSLSMLLQHAGIDVGKMELAKKIKKDPTPYKNKNGVYYYGNPNKGFVGDIYTFDKMGYGVYHGPVTELAEEYLPGKIEDMSGGSFEKVLSKVKKGKPVWIIINSKFKALSESEFKTWNTPDGQVKITWKEHSVVITGFDKTHIYFNDPLSTEKNRKMPINHFKDAWEQMGSQAITYK